MRSPAPRAEGRRGSRHLCRGETAGPGDRVSAEGVQGSGPREEARTARGRLGTQTEVWPPPGPSRGRVQASGAPHTAGRQRPRAGRLGAEACPTRVPEKAAEGLRTFAKGPL